jgi:hypothetical protein
MSNRKIGAINAIIFFVFWLLVLLAGADKPPPLGFIWIILTIAICSAVVHWRVPTYIDWARTRRAGRFWRVLLDGAVAGLLIAVPFALKGSGEPSITMGPVDYAIWFAVLAVMGIFNSVALYFINALVAGRIARSNTKAPSVILEE